MGRIERQRELARRRKRKVKLKKLRVAHAKATDEGAKAALLVKARKMSPFFTFEAQPAAAAE